MLLDSFGVSVEVKLKETKKQANYVFAVVKLKTISVIYNS